jgi:hypothetical protein
MRAIFIWPFRLCFDAALREAWLREMVHEGRNRRIITREDEAKILSRIKEPFVQKFLKNMAVHVLTFPMTRIVSVSLAVFYLLTHPEVPRAQAWAAALGILAFFQLIPVSPGSLTRGLYVLYLVIRERNLRDYSIALPVSFLKTTGYLSFPIQMAYSYPALARFMAVYWATGAVHAVPVFGEKGALLEHWVFSLFYNLPLTMRRRIRERAARRSGIAPRAWHIGPVLAASSIVSSIVDCWFIHAYSRLPRAGELAPMAVLPLVSGVLVAAGAGGASSRRRIAYAALAGACMAVLCALVAAGLGLGFLELFDWSQPATRLLWNMFLYPFVAALSAAGWELVTA